MKELVTCKNIFLTHRKLKIVFIFHLYASTAFCYLTTYCSCFEYVSSMIHLNVVVGGHGEMMELRIYDCAAKADNEWSGNCFGDG